MTTIKDFISPYIEVKKIDCLMGNQVSTKPMALCTIGIILNEDITFDDEGCINLDYGRLIHTLTEEYAVIKFCGQDDIIGHFVRSRKIHLTDDEYTIFIQVPTELEDRVGKLEHSVSHVLCLDLGTKQVTKHRYEIFISKDENEDDGSN